MIHSYEISGMTCEACAYKVKHALQQTKGVTQVDIDWQKGEATVTMEKHVPTASLQEALKPYPKYQLKEKQERAMPSDAHEDQRSWLQTYKPILLIFGYILGITLLIQAVSGVFVWMTWMNHFMAGFFLVFSFFKLLNLSGFADSYSTYDIVAKRWRGYALLYAFIELALGLAYLSDFRPVLTNTVTLVVMSISLIGVLQSVLNKRKIRCACLGDVFNLPMSTVTIIEDALMIAMSAIMLVYLNV